MLVDGIAARFHGSEQSKGEYRLRGEITLLSPADGLPLKCIGEERKRREKRKKTNGGQRKTPTVASANILLRTTEEEAVRKHLVQLTRELIGENALAVQAAFKDARIQKEQTLSLVVLRYSKIYLRSMPLKETTKRKKEGMLRKAASVFGDTPLTQIDGRMIRRIQRGEEALNDRELHLISDFWSFCEKEYGGLPANPFEAEKTRKKTRDGEKEAMKRGTSNYLPPDLERELDIRILEAAKAEPIGLSLVLAKDAGQDAQDMTELKWKDIVFHADDPLFVQIKIEKDYAGWTHDYTRPVFFLAALALKHWYDQLRQKYSEERLSEQYILTGDDMPKKKAITDYIRQTLRHIGVDEGILRAAKGGERKQAAGVRLLLNTYEKKVALQLGLEESDPSAILFLLGRSLGTDVTADHYRSFTSPEGQRKLYIAMRRWGSCVQPVQSNKVSMTEQRTENGYLLRFSPEDPEKRMDLELTLELRAGEELVLWGEYGLTGHVEVETERDEELKTVPWWKLQKKLIGA